MNRFQSYPDRTCLEDLSAPIKHFASCRQNHEFMYRQLAQTRHTPTSVDPNLWDRTTHVWAGSVTRVRRNFLQLVGQTTGKRANAFLILLFLVLATLPLPSESLPPAPDTQPAPVHTHEGREKTATTSGPAPASTQLAAQAIAESTNTSDRALVAAPLQQLPPAESTTTPATSPRPKPAPAPVPIDPAPTPPATPNHALSVSLLDESVADVSLLGIRVTIL